MSIGPTGQNGPVGGILNQMQADGQTLTAILQALKALATPLGVFTAGSWTPALKLGGAAVGMTYSVQTGAYAIIGNVVIAAFTITLSALGSSTGSATITGLPAASRSGVQLSGALGSKNSGMATVSGGVLMSVAAASSTISLLTQGSTATAALADTNFGNSSSISGIVVYLE